MNTNTNWQNRKPGIYCGAFVSVASLVSSTHKSAEKLNVGMSYNDVLAVTHIRYAAVKSLTQKTSSSTSYRGSPLEYLFTEITLPRGPNERLMVVYFALHRNLSILFWGMHVLHVSLIFAVQHAAYPTPIHPFPSRPIPSYPVPSYPIPSRPIPSSSALGVFFQAS